MKLRIDGKTMVDTDKAAAGWNEAEDVDDDDNRLSRNTGSPWDHEILYLSPKRRYYRVCLSTHGTEGPKAEWLTPEQAAQWLVRNDHELPDELAALQAAGNAKPKRKRQAAKRTRKRAPEAPYFELGYRDGQPITVTVRHAVADDFETLEALGFERHDHPETGESTWSAAYRYAMRQELTLGALRHIPYRANS